MKRIIFRSVNEPIRENLTWNEKWKQEDDGLFKCWELGRILGVEDPETAKNAINGQLIPLVWHGGTEKMLKQKIKNGTLNYLAMWQGLRGENLQIDLDQEVILVCSKTMQSVRYSVESTKADEGE